MKKLSLIFVIFAFIIAAGTGIIFTLANQENEIEIPCEHEYAVTAFENGTATLTCTDCGDTFEESFAEHINERDYALFDMNSDGIVNAKDYAILVKNY